MLICPNSSSGEAWLMPSAERASNVTITEAIARILSRVNLVFILLLSTLTGNSTLSFTAVQTVLLVIASINPLLDNTDKTVTVNQASQIFKKPHLNFLPVLFLINYTAEKTEYHRKLCYFL